MAWTLPLHGRVAGSSPADSRNLIVK